MDALALLCTLHADGPTSLKRLRASGCSSIDELVARSPEELAESLEIECAVARRLQREARILGDRVGTLSLDPEEAPPALGRLGRQEIPAAAATPPAPQSSPLDAVDRALVARLSRPDVAAVPEAPDVPENFVPDFGDPQVGEPEQEALTELEPELAPVAEPEVEPEPLLGALETGSLPGLDEALIEDLADLEILTYDDLSRAESLQLTRGLGITFAQARRLRFLARRAADDVVSEAPAKEAPVAENSVAAAHVAEAPARQAASPAQAAPPVQAARPAKGAAPPVQEEQGVRIDPAEIEPRRTFAEQFARAAAARRLAETPTDGRTVLGWNFEIPRPESDSLPFASISAPAPLDRVDGPPAGFTAESTVGPFVGPEDDIAGPFARA